MQLNETSKTDNAHRVLIGVAVLVVGFYLMTEHRAHLYGALPYLLLLTCPLMHVFMHRSHGDHGPDVHEKNIAGKAIKEEGEGPKACH